MQGLCAWLFIFLYILPFQGPLEMLRNRLGTWYIHSGTHHTIPYKIITHKIQYQIITQHHLSDNYPHHSVSYAHSFPYNMI